MCGVCVGGLQFLPDRTVYCFTLPSVFLSTVIRKKGNMLNQQVALYLERNETEKKKSAQ